jgi:carboxyl-terminal processing protease
MSKHVFRPRRAIYALLAVFAFTGAFAQTPAPASPTQDSAPKLPPSAKVSAAQKQEILDKMNDIIEKNAFVPGVDFTKWPSFLSAERTDIDKSDNDREFALAVNKALHKFGFSHMALITPESVTARLTEKSVGIGVLLQAETDGMRVLNVFEDSPAEEAGLVRGDLIIEGNGKKPESPVELLGDEGTSLTIKVKHENGNVQSYTLTRRKYSNVRPETLTWYDKDTAVLKVNTFDLSYNRTNVEMLVKQAEDQNAKNLILDLRSNPGGSILNLVHLMGLLLPPNTPLGTFITRSSVNNYVKDENGKPTDLAAIARYSKSGRLTAKEDPVPYFKGHIAVLVNGGSGSAAEIAAAALRDDIEAPIVGSKSAGAVLVSIMNQMPDNFMLQFPISDFVTVNGVRLEGTGVTPEIETPEIVKYNEKDAAIDKAALLLDRADLRDARSGSASVHPTAGG